MSTLYAISDLHIAYAENRELLEQIRPPSTEDWLIVAGDVGEVHDEVIEALALLSERFARVVWTPGNHELWTHTRDPLKLRGEERYLSLVRACRNIGVLTPEDDYAVWQGPGGPAVIAPLFVLYDYSFRVPGAATKEQSLALAHQQGIVCTDEMFLHPDPFPSREQWCWARVELTEKRLGAIDPGLPTILVNHYPLVREPTNVLRYPVFAQWCGTELTADWHVRFRAAASIYGHLHIPRVTWHDGVRFEEVSIGYPHEWKKRDRPPALLRPVFP